MRKNDVPLGPSRQQVSDRDGERPDDGGAPAAPAPAEDGSTSSDAQREKELLCTICGLRACWQ